MERQEKDAKKSKTNKEDNVTAHTMDQIKTYNNRENIGDTVIAPKMDTKKIENKDHMEVKKRREKQKE